MRKILQIILALHLTEYKSVILNIEKLDRYNSKRITKKSTENTYVLQFESQFVHVCL
jgi:hypothetical protein